MIDIRFGDNLEILKQMESASVDLIYIDPPFNTGKTQPRTSIRTVQSEEGGRIGFQGKRYITETVSSQSYRDRYDNYIEFLEPRMIEACRILKDNGSLYFHIDYREVHYCKIMLDDIFGRESFINEVIWSYDYGARTKKKWPAKHDNILFYAKDPKHYTFNYEAIDRIPYLAPDLVGAEKAARGKTPTDVWWHTIVPTNGREKTGYPTQKPEGILRRIIATSTNPGDLVLDFFAGSGTTGAVCKQLGRDCILIDNNPDAIAIMQKRLGD